jgi:16S rRNA A1518/A1519 N6-dimethyltransferase RsmA/KsgA/DIM1 with predicted DNA glycosylase/AP lyase activity
MKQFSMETEDRIIETAEVSGNQAVFEVYKGGGEGTIMIRVQEKMLVVIEVDSVAGKGELISLAEDVPLSDIAAQR